MRCRQACDRERPVGKPVCTVCWLHLTPGIRAAYSLARNKDDTAMAARRVFEYLAANPPPHVAAAEPCTSANSGTAGTCTTSSGTGSPPRLSTGRWSTMAWAPTPTPGSPRQRSTSISSVTRRPAEAHGSLSRKRRQRSCVVCCSSASGPTGTKSGCSRPLRWQSIRPCSGRAQPTCMPWG